MMYFHILTELLQLHFYRYLTFSKKKNIQISKLQTVEYSDPDICVHPYLLHPKKKLLDFVWIFETV